MASLDSLLKNYSTRRKTTAPEDDFDALLASYAPPSAEEEEPAADDGLFSDTALDQVPKAGIAGLGDIGADLMFRDIDAKAAEEIRLRNEEQAIKDSSLPEPLARFMLTDPISPAVNKVAEFVGSNDTYKQVFGSLSDYVTKARQEVEADVTKTIAAHPVRGRVERAATDFAGSALSSAASIPGGPFAAIPAVIQKNDSYRAAREAGADPDDAEEYANLMAAAEGGISAIPTGRLFKTLSKPWFKTAETILAKKVAGTGVRTLTTMAGEAVEEGVTQGVQEGINQGVAASDSTAADYAGKERSKTVQEAVDKIGRAAGAGALGGTISAPSHHTQVAFEKGQEFAKTLGHAEDEFKTLAEKASIDRQMGDYAKDNNLDILARDADNAQQEQDIFEAKEKAEADRKADEEEAMHRNNELRAKEAEMADSPMGRAMIKGFEWTPEMVAKERTAKAEAAAKDRYAQEESTRRLQEDMDRLDAEDKAKAEAAKPKPVEAAKPAPAPVVEEEDAGPSDADVRKMAKDAGLNVADPTVPLSKKPTKSEKPSIDFDDYKKKLNSFLGGLVDKNDQQATDVRSLINQRKLVVAPNPESIGRKDGGEAMYDPKTGKMYVYLDRINPENTVGNIAAAVHEATHGGQYNARAGRGRVLESIFAKAPTSKLKAQIKDAYGKNTLATKAVDSATEARETAAKEFPHLSEDQLDQLEGLELMAYFADAAQQPGTKGRLRGVADGLVAGTRSLLRNAGVDMDVTLNDVEHATRKIIGEMVKTDMKPLSDNEAEQKLNTPLAMIGGEYGRSFQKAKLEGKTYKGRVDKKERYEIADNEAELNASPSTASGLMSGYTMKLPNVLKHKKLFEEYPVLKDIEVRVDPSMKGKNVHGSYYAGVIDLNPTMVEMAMDFPATPEAQEKLRRLLLHETQHAVQALEDHSHGANKDQFIPEKIVKARDEAQEAMDGFLYNFPLSTAIDSLNDEAKRAWQQEEKMMDWTHTDKSEPLKKALFLREGYHEDSGSRVIQKYGEKFAELDAKLFAAKTKYQDVNNKAFRTYQRNYGETEARNTEHRSRMTPEELQLSYPESTMKDAEGNVAAEDTLDTTEFAAKSMPAESVDDSFEERRKKKTQEKSRQDFLEEQQKIMDEADAKIRAYEEKYSDYTPEKEADDIIKQMGKDVTRFERAKIISDVKKQRVRVKELTDNGDGDVPLSRKSGSKTPEPNLSERERVRRIVEHGTRSRTADLKIAEDLDSKYKRAMKADGKDVNDPKIHKEIVDLLTAIDNDTGAKRTAMWKNFQKKYPATSKVLAAMRDRMDALAKEFLESKLNSGKELNKQEIAEVMEVMKNMNRYLPRAFSALQPQVGKAWAGRRLQDYLNTQPTGNFRERILKKIDSLGRRLNPQTKQNVAIIKQGIEFFEKKFVIPTDDVLAGLPSSDLVRMYEDHVGPIRTLRHDGTAEGKHDALLSELAYQRKLVSPETLKNMAENAVREMLGLSEEPDSSATVKAFKKAFNSTEKLGAEATAIPEELAKLLGEIHDPAGRVLITLAKQSALMSRAKMLGELYNDYQGDLVIPKAKINEAGMREKFSKPLNGQHYGPLDGFYATPALADKLKASYEGFSMFNEIMNNVFKVTQQLTRKEKIAGIIIDPINWATNFSGSGITLLMNGNFSPAAMAKGAVTARDYLYGTARDGTTKMLDDAQRYLGIEAVEAAEIQHILGDKLKMYLDGKMDSSSVMKALNAVAAPERTRAGRVLIAGYAVSDAWAKIANFHDRIRVLQDYYKALGDSKTIEEIKREAGADASFTNFSAERVPRVLTLGDRKGVTKFGGYFAESFRTPIANYIQAKIDIQRAIDTKKLGGAKAEKAANVMMVAATKRLVGNSLATLIMPAQLALRYNKFAAAMGLGAAFLLTGEDDDDELKRLMVSEWNRTGDLIDFGKDKDGKPVFYNASAKMDPIGPATDLIRDIHTAEDPAQAGEAIIQDIKDLVISAAWMKRAWKAFTLPKVPESELANTFPAQADTFRDAVEATGFDTSTANKAMYIASSWMPGMVKSWNPKYIPQMQNDKTAEFMAKMGADFEVLDPNKAMNNYGFAAKEVYDDARKKMNDSLSSRDTLKSEHMLNAAVRYAAEYKVQLLQDRRYAESLRAWGYKDEEIVEMFKTNGWSKTQAQRIVDGEMDVPISMKSFKEVTRLKKQGARDDEQKEKLDDRYEQVEEWVEKHRGELEKMGIEVTE